MSHPLVTQLRFARSEFVRGLEGTPPADALRRLEPMNCISWIVGHLAGQEHFLWVMAAQGENIAPNLYQWVGTGQPASTPPWDEMWSIWQQVTAKADKYLDTIDDVVLATHLSFNGKTLPETVGISLLRNTYHYWFHLGEAHAIRQQLGHPKLPQYVGDMETVRYGQE